MTRRAHFFNAILDFFFPRLCVFCGQLTDHDSDAVVCDECQGQVEQVVGPLCRQCGAPFPDARGLEELCLACQHEPPPFTRARAPVFYSGPVQEAIHRLKYQRQMVYARPLKEWLTGEAGWELAREADLILPVPLHPRRLRQRGFNQALLLARAFAGVPLAPNLLIRRRWTEPQVNLDGAARRDNIRDAFAVREPAAVAEKNLLLIDDVLTTGATVSECARVLLAAGAARVEVLTVARVGYARV